MRLKNCNAERLIEELDGRKIICFGAGLTLETEKNRKTRIEHLEEHIAFFVDNDMRKHGLKYYYRGYEYDIKSVEAFKTVNMSDYVILITCAAYKAIYEQLDDIEVLKDVDCYMYGPVCDFPDIDVDNFFTNEVQKRNYREYKQVLKELNLKDKHKGERCFIIGNGPSLKAEDLELLKSEVTFAANRIFQIFPDTSWRPTYYFYIDHEGYGVDHKEISQMDHTMRFVPFEIAWAAGKVYEEIYFYNRVIKLAEVQDGNIVRSSKTGFSEDITEQVFAKYQAMYDVMQFAIYMGFKEIYLLGIDCAYKYHLQENGTVEETDVERSHFSDSYKFSSEDKSPVNVSEMQRGWCKIKEVCESKNIFIKNATRGGRLEIFERVSLESILRECI